MTPYVSDPDFTLYVGDVREVLAALPAGSVDCCVTSPPYWGLRDYGTGEWEGGDPDCDHSVGGQVEDSKAPGAISTGQRPGVDASRCRKCGATRVDRQIGLEQTPEQYVEQMVAVFREVRRVLTDAGTVWLNLGDSYVSTAPGTADKPQRMNGMTDDHRGSQRIRPRIESLKPKDLVGIPWRVALALQADGWYLRSDIIWAKPNPMPESVTDRPTKAHEYVFLLTKQPRYFFDQEAVREKYSDDRMGQSYPNGAPEQQDSKGNPDRNDGGHTSSARRTGLTGGAYAPPGQPPHGNARGPDGRRKTAVQGADGSIQHRDGERWPNGGRNVRSVWEIATQPYPDAHFATFPEALPERCIKAGCPEGGTVLDPFLGSGTTALVARRLGRKSVGIELNPEYAKLAARRLQQLSLLADV